MTDIAGVKLVTLIREEIGETSWQFAKRWTHRYKKFRSFLRFEQEGQKLSPEDLIHLFEMYRDECEGDEVGFIELIYKSVD